MAATTRIILFMAIADFFSMVSKFLGRWPPDDGPNSAACQLQAAMMQFGDNSSIFWTCAISINLILVLKYNYSVDQIVGLEKRYVFFCYVPNIIWAIVPIFIVFGDGQRLYGDAVLWYVYLYGGF